MNKGEPVSCTSNFHLLSEIDYANRILFRHISALIIPIREYFFINRAWIFDKELWSQC